jgi:hypothetical protein
VDYLNYADDPDGLEFYARAYGRDITLWAWEAYEVRRGNYPVPEFGQTSEAALVNGTYYIYDDHGDDAANLAEKMFGPPRPHE